MPRDQSKHLAQQNCFTPEYPMTPYQNDVRFFSVARLNRCRPVPPLASGMRYEYPGKNACGSTAENTRFPQFG